MEDEQETIGEKEGTLTEQKSNDAGNDKEDEEIVPENENTILEKGAETLVSPKRGRGRPSKKRLSVSSNVSNENITDEKPNTEDDAIVETVEAKGDAVIQQNDEGDVKGDEKIVPNNEKVKLEKETETLVSPKRGRGRPSKKRLSVSSNGSNENINDETPAKPEDEPETIRVKGDALTEQKLNDAGDVKEDEKSVLEKETETLVSPKRGRGRPSKKRFSVSSNTSNENVTDEKPNAEDDTNTSLKTSPKETTPDNKNDNTGSQIAQTLEPENGSQVPSEDTLKVEKTSRSQKPISQNVPKELAVPIPQENMGVDAEYLPLFHQPIIVEGKRARKPKKRYDEEEYISPKEISSPNSSSKSPRVEDKAVKEDAKSPRSQKKSAEDKARAAAENTPIVESPKKKSKPIVESPKKKSKPAPAEGTINFKNIQDKIRPKKVKVIKSAPSTPKSAAAVQSPKGPGQSEDKKVKKRDVILERPDGSMYRKCGMSRCTSDIPICAIRCAARCCGDGMTSRWYHLSAGEHYCNDCFEYYYRSQKAGFPMLEQWKKEWSENGKTEPTIKTFMIDQVLFYWVQCNECRKWREMSANFQLTPEFIRKFVCGMSEDEEETGSPSETECAKPMDKRAEEVLDENWITSLILPPYLKFSPSTPFLASYYPDCVGLSAVDNELPTNMAHLKADKENNFDAGPPHVSGTSRFMHMFAEPTDVAMAMCYKPEVMDSDEVETFSEYAHAQHMYLSLRNLVLSLWCLNYKEYLTVDRCVPYLICRGLVRIRCHYEIDRIIRYLTQKGAINTGILRNLPKEIYFDSDEQLKQAKVLVIGAGASGIAAARLLQLLGLEVTVLEARDRLGGRVWDRPLGQATVGEGAQVLSGSLNNPFALICQQKDRPLSELSENCRLIEPGGATVDSYTDHTIEFHFNAMLDNIAEWRKKNKNKKDTNLMAKFKEMHNQFIEESGMQFSEKELKMLDFHVGNLEYVCGATLDKISATNWDQNEAFPQFGGKHAILKNGYGEILQKLAKDLNIEYNTIVYSVDYSGDQVIVSDSGKRKWTADKVVITVPLAILQGEQIKFTPKLNAEKIAAFNSLATGHVEKVTLLFPRCFWKSKLNGNSYFGRVVSKEKDRGLFSVFTDLSTQNEEGASYILSTHICGEALSNLQQKSDKQVVDMAMKILNELFPEEDVPKPTKYYVSHWSSDPYSKMAYSYVPVGCDASVFDQIARSVADKLYFAGEATNRQHPQTVTGAYLSGIREANKIIDSLVEGRPAKPEIPAIKETPKSKSRTKDRSPKTETPNNESNPAKRKKKSDTPKPEATPKSKKEKSDIPKAESISTLKSKKTKSESPKPETNKSQVAKKKKSDTLKNESVVKKRKTKASKDDSTEEKTDVKHISPSNTQALLGSIGLDIVGEYLSSTKEDETQDDYKDIITEAPDKVLANGDEAHESRNTQEKESLNSSNVSNGEHTENSDKETEAKEEHSESTESKECENETASEDSSKEEEIESQNETATGKDEHKEGIHKDENEPLGNDLKASDQAELNIVKENVEDDGSQNGDKMEGNTVDDNENSNELEDNVNKMDETVTREDGLIKSKIDSMEENAERNCDDDNQMDDSIKEPNVCEPKLKTADDPNTSATERTKDTECGDEEESMDTT
ncbi:unnamed protein product [Owenia fusiformis]|uniref:Lysine-specific histone demethylase 1B n=1 Tax=Owenia fusiformis TaxID=6347 RepID=A0A8S4MWM1_OWEFU|nr:unnamed protein product [Owenia fusiformis]